MDEKVSFSSISKVVDKEKSVCIGFELIELQRTCVLFKHVVNKTKRGLIQIPSTGSLISDEKGER